MDSLPQDVLFDILGLLAPPDVVSAAATSSRGALGVAALDEIRREREAHDLFRADYGPALDVCPAEARNLCAACGLPGLRPYGELLQDVRETLRGRALNEFIREGCWRLMHTWFPS